METDITIGTITEWIKDRAREANAQALVVGVSGGVDSAVVAALCKRTRISTVGVIMPCQSSPSSIARAREVTKLFTDVEHFVDLGGAFDSIVGQVKRDLNRPSAGALRSCLRAPTLDFVAKIYNGIIVGTGNRDEDEVTRYYQKRGDGCVDISPIAKLHKSEVYIVAKKLGVPWSVIDAVPSADLWGPDAGQTDEGQLGMSYKEIEWAIQLAQHNGQDVSALDLLVASLKPDLSERQKLVLRQLADMEVASRHKANPNIPVCKVR